MADMFNFFLEIGVGFFNFVSSAEIFSGFTLLDFTVGLFLLNLVVVNFIILAKRYNNSSSRPSGSGRSSNKDI